MSRRSAKHLVLLVLLLAVSSGTVLFYNSDRYIATEREFNGEAIRSLGENRIRAVSKTKSMDEMDSLFSQAEQNESLRLKARGASIRSDQEKKVFWSGRQFQAPLALVYIHGFSASRLELEPVISELGARLGANVFFTRLTAHGLSDGEEFGSVRARDWAVDVDEALAVGRKIGQRVIVMGASTGAALVLDGFHRIIPQDRGVLSASSAASANHTSNVSVEASPEAIVGLILFSPNYALKDFGGFLLEGSLGPSMARLILGTHRQFPIENPLHGERWTTRYRSEGLAAMMTAVRRVQQIDFAQWEPPILTVYTERDDVVSVAAIKEVSARFPKSSEVIDWPAAQRHQLASATFHPEAVPGLIDLISDWIHRKAMVAHERGR